MPLSLEQKTLRRHGIGGSEIAAVAGVHPYKTPLDVYLDKVGLKVEEPETEAQAIGRYLEGALLAAYCERMHVPVITRPDTIVSEADKWMLVTPDAMAEDGVDEARGIEAKVRNFRDLPRWGEPGTDQVPDEVALQCHWGMMITGVARWDVIAYLAGTELRIYTLRLDEAIAHKLRMLGHAFWTEHVMKCHPPRLDGSKASVEFVKALHPRHDDRMLTALEDNEVVALARDLERVREANKRGETEETILKLRIEEFIGDAAGILGPPSYPFKATWKRPKDSQRTDWEAVAAKLGATVPPAVFKEIVQECTQVKQNSRRFLFQPPGGD